MFTDLASYLRFLRRWWWMLAACALAAAVSSYIGTRQMPRIYQATTTVAVGQTLSMANPSGMDIYTSQQLATTYAQTVTRRPILEAAAQSLGLTFSPSPGDVTARQVAGTQLLEISLRDTDPQRAAALADAIAQQLVLQSPTEGGQEAQRRTFVLEQLADLERNIQDTKEGIAAEQAKLDAANSARAIQQYQANISALEQKQSSYQSTYASLLLTVQGGSNYIAIVEPARVPTSPVSPNVPQMVIVSAALGLLLGVLGAAGIEALNDTVQDIEEARQLTGLPVMAAVARMPGEGYGQKLITVLDPRSPIAESFRVLRTNVQYASPDRPLRTLLVTSPGPSEGKSVTLANLAVVLAESGLRTVILDTDLRRPAQHSIFEVENDRGLSDLFLDREADVRDYLRPTAVENLRLLCAGRVPPSPSEMLGSQRMRDVMAALEGEVDVLLLDSPPTLVVTDASILGSRVDGALLVVDIGRTRRGMARQAVEQLKRSRANLLGVVANRVQASRAGYYYTYYYYRYSADGTRTRQRRSRRPRLGAAPTASPERAANTPSADGGC